MEDTKVDLTYKRGFEMGYWLERGKYQKLDQFVKSAEIHPEFQKGLKHGRKEVSREVVRQAFKAIRDKQDNDNGIDVD